MTSYSTPSSGECSPPAASGQGTRGPSQREQARARGDQPERHRQEAAPQIVQAGMSPPEH